MRLIADLEVVQVENVLHGRAGSERRLSLLLFSGDLLHHLEDCASINDTEAGALGLSIRRGDVRRMSTDCLLVGRLVVIASGG